MAANKKKVLLIRLDKIGDLICTLPADQILDDSFFDITWVVQKGLGQILDLGEKKRNYLELDKNQPQLAQKKFAVFLKENNFDIAISFQCPWWINWELFKARIKKRIGVLSQWHSFLFLNNGLRQKRSQAVKHEFDYNLDLALQITGPMPSGILETLYFRFKKPNSSEVLQKYNLPLTYTVVHPGMMGSALNWSQEQYIDYINQKIQQNKTIVVTGTLADEPYLNRIREIFLNHPQIIWLQSQLTMRELIEVIYYSDKVIVPSTGVAHIAASLDKEVHGIYSPIQVHHPKRWAPRGSQVIIHIPSHKCPAQFKCLGPACEFFNCMENVIVED